MARSAPTYYVPRRPAEQPLLRLLPKPVPGLGSERRWPHYAITTTPYSAVLFSASAVLVLGVAWHRLRSRRTGANSQTPTVAELLSVVRQRDDALVSAAHDLRTPLTALKGQAQLLQRFVRPDDDEGARLRAGLAAIDAAASAAAVRIDRLVDESERRLPPVG